MDAPKSTTLKCSACATRLAEITWIPNPELNFTFVGLCPCGDKSFPLQINGLVKALGSTDVVDHIDHIIEGDITTIHTVRRVK